MRYEDKYSDKSEDFVHDKMQQAKEKEVENLLFQDALRKARNQKANLQEISSWLIPNDDEEVEVKEKEKPKKNKKEETKTTPVKRVTRQITDWFV